MKKYNGRPVLFVHCCVHGRYTKIKQKKTFAHFMYILLRRFIHCTPEEVEEYKSTGQMSPQIIVEASRKNQLPGSLPICKEFKKGLCRRKFCRYRHITKEQEEAEILEMLQNHTRKNQIILTNANDSQLLTIGSLNGELNCVNFI